jgi:nucleoside-diphosphate-sugar epimerase
MAVLVTGGSGFVGKWVIQLLAEEQTVVNLDTQIICPEEKNVVSLKADLTDLVRLTEITKEVEEPIESIIHLAAASRLPSFLDNPYGNVKLNVWGTVNVLELSRRLGVRRVVYASSGAVYGARFDIPGEDAPLSPTELYGATKACGELLGMRYADHFGFEFIAVRLFMVYGPGLIPSKSGEPFRALFGPLEGKTEEKLGAGSDQKFGFTYVADAARGIMCALKSQELRHHLYNISSEIGYYPSQVVEIVRKYAPVPFAVDLSPGVLLPRPPTLDISLAQAELGYHPAYDLDRGIREYAEWLQSQNTNKEARRDEKEHH